MQDFVRYVFATTYVKKSKEAIFSTKDSINATMQEV